MGPSYALILPPGGSLLRAHFQPAQAIRASNRHAVRRPRQPARFSPGALRQPGEPRQDARLVAEWEAAGRRLPHKGGSSADLTINELLVSFWTYAVKHYAGSGRELENFKLSLPA